MDEKQMREKNEPFRLSDTNTDSDRVLVTKKVIFFALRDLVKEHGFASVSASDIIERAGVSRSTFYRCFSDKYDVANWAYKRYKNIRLQDKDQYYSFETALRAQLEHLSENREFFAAALRYRGQNSLSDYMVETNEEYMTQCWKAAHGGEPGLEEALAIAFSAAGCSYLIKRWVFNGCVENPDSVVSAICDCIPPFVLKTLF
uniref:Transcriptional regulator n=1 Tax=uncultured bacterium Contig1491 TaxID=1393439 RepID=W0FPW0_9BACT|nr:transcriptional regulator [uncultured bacterium Contig1491]